MRGKYSPTVSKAYMKDQDWWRKYAGTDREDVYVDRDPDGYDHYGYNDNDVDRAGNSEYIYYRNDAALHDINTEQDYNLEYDKVYSEWGFDGVKPVWVYPKESTVPEVSPKETKKKTRETKEQKVIRLAAEEEEKQKELISTYPSRLMSILKRAQEVGCDVVILDELNFFVSKCTMFNDYTLEYQYSEKSDIELWDLSRVISIQEYEIQERTRLELLKQQALNKLSDEERKVLGL